MRERVLVAGAGIAGLGLALALGGGRREIIVVDRDPPPPDTSADDAFRSWERKGVTQLRHSHVFLGRLTSLIRDRYPGLMDELSDAGVRIFGFADGLPLPLRNRYVPAPGDKNLAILFSRRTTLELVMRRHAARLDGVTFLTATNVRGLIAGRGGDGRLVARGLRVERNGADEELAGDVIVDACGRNSNFPDWLAALGAQVPQEESPAGILYYTRHYRLRDGQGEPPRDGTPGAGDLGYIKYGVFIADNRHFSITLAVPEIETELRAAIMRPDIFDAVCARIPGTARWTEAARAEPASKVFAMGNLKSVWRRYTVDGEPIALNFFAIGDAAVRTNPLYGRGCSAGVVHAHVLAAALDATADPRERAMLVERESRQELRPYYDAMVRADLQAIRRAEHERDPGYRPGLRARLMKNFADHAIVPATRGDLAVFRAFMKGFHMFEDPARWLKDPAILVRLVRMWLASADQKRRRGFYPPRLGPARNEMLAILGLAA